MSELKRLQDRHAALVREMRGIVDNLDAEHRTALTADEGARFKRAEDELKSVERKLGTESRLLAEEKALKTVPDPNRPTRQEWNERHGADLGHTVPEFPSEDRELAVTAWKDQNGKPVKMLAPTQKITEHCLPVRRSNLHLGKLIRGRITGDWTDAPGERLAMSSGVNSAGGYLVPEELSAEILDLARAESVVLRAGARTIPMNSDSLIIARVTADPTMSQKAENDSFSATAPAFDGIGFVTETWGALVTASRELAADAPNFADSIKAMLVKALAVKLDSLALNLDATHFGSIPSAANVNTVSVGGALSFEKLSEAIKDIEGYNYSPASYVVSPSNKSKLSLLTTGDGVNSSKNWLGPSPDVAELRRYVTTSMLDSAAIVGDFSHCAFGVRLAAEVSVSEEAGTSFASNQIWIRIVWRGCFRVLQSRAFAYLSGIS